jgi:hypothetical protein
MAEAPQRVNSIVPGAKIRHYRCMKPLYVAIALVVLGGCAQLTLYHKAGKSVPDMETDAAACAVAALREVPVSNQLRRDPPEYIPGPTQCDSSGNCVQGPGFFIPGAVFTVDANQALRERATDACMAAKGYDKVTLPNCRAGQTVPRAQTDILPVLTAGTCAIRLPQGKWQIITPSP